VEFFETLVPGLFTRPSKIEALKLQRKSQKRKLLGRRADEN